MHAWEKSYVRLGRLNMEWLTIAVCAVVVVLTVTVEHYWPWEHLVRRMHMLARYVMGCLAIDIPMSVVLVLWQEWLVLGLLWISTIAGGIALVFLYLLDCHLETRAAHDAMKRENAVLREEIDGEITR